MEEVPATIEDLEQTNQIRFLRKRYNDPMTGKSEWRIVHVGPGGVFTDSLTHKPPALNKEDPKSVNTFTWEAPQTGQAASPGQATPGFQPVRPSERAGMRLPGQFQPGQPVDPANPQAQQPGYPPTGFAGYPNPNQQQQPGVYNPNQPTQLARFHREFRAPGPIPSYIQASSPACIRASSSPSLILASSRSCIRASSPESTQASRLIRRPAACSPIPIRHSRARPALRLPSANPAARPILPGSPARTRR